MGVYYKGWFYVRGKPEDIKKFNEKYCPISSFFKQFDLWPSHTIERSETEIKVFIEGKRISIDNVEEMFEKCKNSKLTISFAAQWESIFFYFFQNKIHNRDKFTPNLTSESSKILNYLDKKYNIIPPCGDVFTLEDEGHDEQKQLVDYQNIFNRKKFRPNSIFWGSSTVVLSNITLNYSGKKTIDKIKTIDYAKYLIDCYYPTDLVFKITSKSESEELIKTLKDYFDFVKIIKTPMVTVKNSTD